MHVQPTDADVVKFLRGALAKRARRLLRSTQRPLSLGSGTPQVVALISRPRTGPTGCRPADSRKDGKIIVNYAGWDQNKVIAGQTLRADR